MWKVSALQANRTQMSMKFLLMITVNNHSLSNLALLIDFREGSLNDNHSEYPHIPLGNLNQVKSYKNLRGRLYYRISVEERVYGSRI